MTIALPSSSLRHRLFRGGVTLSPLEAAALEALVEHLPPSFVPSLTGQFGAINLIQRDPDWLETRFYRLEGGRPSSEQLPRLPVTPGEVKLLSLVIRQSTADKPLHTNFWAVDGVFFVINFGMSAKPLASLRAPLVSDVEHSWRSNVRSDGA